MWGAMESDNRLLGDTYSGIIRFVRKQVKFKEQELEEINNRIEELKRKGSEKSVIEAYENSAKELKTEIDAVKETGFPGIDYRDYNYLKGHQTQLNEMFFTKYADYRLGITTIEEWHIKLQNKFDAIADGYNERLKILVDVRNEKYEEQSTSDVSQSNDSTSKESDLPNSKVSIAEYAGHVTTVDGKAANKVTNTNVNSITRMLMHREIRDFDRNILYEFIDEFEDIFSGVWYF